MQLAQQQGLPQGAIPPSKRVSSRIPIWRSSILILKTEARELFQGKYLVLKVILNI